MRTKYISFVLLCLLFIPVVNACTSTSSIGSDNNAVNKLPEPPKSMVSVVKEIELRSFVQLPNGIKEEDFENYRRAKILNSRANTKVFNLVMNLQKINSWQEADKQARVCLEGIKNEEDAWYHSQMVAATMVKTYLLSLPPDLEVQRAVEFYINTLFQYNNYNEVVMIARALPMLKGYWTNEKLYQVALKHYQHINNKVPASIYVIRDFGYRAEKLAKKSPEKYTLSSEIAILAGNVKKQFWEEKVENILNRKQIVVEQEPQTTEEHIQRMNDSKLAIALLVEYFEAQSDFKR